MSGGISLGTALAGVALASQMLMPKGQAAPKAPTVEPPPQASQAPDESLRRKSAGASGGYGPGNSSTMLTDSSGVSPADLLLGKNKLFGQ